MSGGAVSAVEEMHRVTLRWLPAVTWTLATAYAELVIRRHRPPKTRRRRARLIKVVRFVLALVLLPMFLVLAALCGGWHYDGRVYVWVHRRGHLPRPTWAGASCIAALVGALALLVIANAALDVPAELVPFELAGLLMAGVGVLLLSAIKTGTLGGPTRADWTLDIVASCLPHGGLGIIARHVETLVDPSESIAATAASGEHAHIYRRFGFQDVPGRPLQLFRPGKTTPAP